MRKKLLIQGSSRNEDGKRRFKAEMIMQRNMKLRGKSKQRTEYFLIPNLHTVRGIKCIMSDPGRGIITMDSSGRTAAGMSQVLSIQLV